MNSVEATRLEDANSCDPSPTVSNKTAPGSPANSQTEPNMPLIRAEDVPNMPQSDITFTDTSFFRQDQDRALPSPEELTATWGPGRRVIIMKDLNLVIKRRFDLGYLPLNFEEVQVMRAIAKVFPNKEVPVPEVFGWKRHDDHSFIYMSLVSGTTLYTAWPSLTYKDKESISSQLSEIIGNLRRMTRSPASNSICSINGGTVQDIFLRRKYAGGPFETAQAFNNWVLGAAIGRPPTKIVLDRYMDGQYRDQLPDNSSVVFTHGDLHMDNIMVAGEPGSFKVTGIIDWEQAGWYPEYWEYAKFKLHDTTDEGHTAGWADRIMEAFPAASRAIEVYHNWRVV